MYLYKNLSDGLSIFMLGMVSAAVPLGQVFASAPQWRPVSVVQNSSVPRTVSHGGFRPVTVNPNSTQTSKPVFTRQYAWRSAPSSWMPGQKTTSSPAATHQYRPMEPALKSVAVKHTRLAVQGRWRPIDMNINAPELVADASLSRMNQGSNAWRPMVRSVTVSQSQVQQPVIAQVNAARSTQRGYWSQPQQPVWPYMPMPFGGAMQYPGYTTPYMPQTASVYPQYGAYPRNAYAPALPPMPHYANSSTMMRPRWVNGRAVWPNPRQNSVSQPMLPVKKGTLATLPTERLCVGCDS